jgi:hypothetical protein
MVIPSEWFVVFKRKSAMRWANWVPGKFKHCLAMTFIAERQAWLFVEFAALSGTAVSICANDGADDWLAEASRDAVVVKVPAGMSKGWAWGLWCVPLTAHVIGLRSSALLPDGLFRDCMANGGEIVIAGDGYDGNDQHGFRRQVEAAEGA